MTEVENSSVIEEVANPEIAGVPPGQPETKAEDDREINFRKLREKADRLEQEKEKDQQLIREMQAEFIRRDAKPKEVESDPLSDIDPNDWATFEQSQRGAEKIAGSIVDKKIREYEKERKAKELPDLLKKEFPDFDSVMTKENVLKMKALDPDIFEALQMIPDEEKQATAAYKFIKSIVGGVDPAVQEERKMLEENASLPKSVNTAGGKSPLSQAHDFGRRMTSELKDQLWKELNECSRG